MNGFAKVRSDSDGAAIAAVMWKTSDSVDVLGKVTLIRYLSSAVKACDPAERRNGDTEF